MLPVDLRGPEDDHRSVDLGDAASLRPGTECRATPDADRPDRSSGLPPSLPAPRAEIRAPDRFLSDLFRFLPASDGGGGDSVSSDNTQTGGIDQAPRAATAPPAGCDG